MYEYLKGVLEYGFANRCEGATVLGMEMNHLSCQMVFPLCWNRKGARVHGMEMNHISNNYSGTFEGGPRRWFGYCVCVCGGGGGMDIFSEVSIACYTHLGTMSPT